MATYAVILAGGGGTRLWPASRRKRPKQFLPLAPGGRSLLGATVDRIGPSIPPQRVLVVTAASQVDEVWSTLPELPGENLIIEPVGRNTAPCIALAALELVRRDPEAVLAVLPADHYVADRAAFNMILVRALAEAQSHNAVVTLGIRPSHPETGFGYLELEKRPPAEGQRAELEAAPVVRFVEKPDRITAQRYVESGRFLWNSGIFFFRARRLLELVAEHMPPLAEILDSIERAPPDRRAAVVNERYPSAPNISIDYGIMEKTKGILCIPAAFGWNDVGSFAALAEIHAADADGNVMLGDALAAGHAKRNVVVADPGRVVALVGVEDLAVVATPDAVLVMPRQRAQEVREVVAALLRTGRDRYL